MEKRELGHSGLQVAPLAFGGNVFGWTADEPTSFALLDAFVDFGCNLIDTADTYSIWVPGHAGGESETLIGKWLKRSGKRDRVLIASKVGMRMGENRKGLSRDYILSAVDASLRRLQTDYLDLYQSHIDDPATPLEETLETYQHLIRHGKVRAIGASNYSAERLARALDLSEAHGYPRYQSLQPLYNLCDRAEYETGLEPLCRKRGVGVIGYYSLAAGFLSGKYRSEKDLANRARGRTVEKYLGPRGYAILEALDQVARQCAATPAQVALAWVMARPGVTAAIASATSLKQLDELIAATGLALDRPSIELLNRASD